jgi:hypothetical protein
MSFSIKAFTPVQLLWLQDMQLWVDKTLEEIEPAPTNESPTQDRSDWRGHIVIQGKIDSGAPDLHIPLSAVPNVMACWNARRNRLGLGMPCATQPLFQLFFLTHL